MVFNRYALAEFMRLRMLTATELSTRTKLSKSYVSELLSGAKATPSRIALRNIAKVLDVMPEALFVTIREPVAA